MRSAVSTSTCMLSTAAEMIAWGAGMVPCVFLVSIAGMAAIIMPASRMVPPGMTYPLASKGCALAGFSVIQALA